jgi:hypothetical protein
VIVLNILTSDSIFGHDIVEAKIDDVANLLVKPLPKAPFLFVPAEQAAGILSPH